MRCVRIPSIILVFGAFFLVALLQIPLHYIFSGEMFSLRIIVNEIVVILGVPLIFVYLFNFECKRLFPFKRISVSTVVIVVITIFAADVVIDYLTKASEYFFPPPQWVQDSLDRLMEVKGIKDIVWKIIILCALPAVCEEIFFRGYCQSAIASRLGVWKAVVITSLLFAAMHGNPWYFHLYFILSLVIGGIYALTGNLWAAIICHFLNNVWTFVNHILGFEVPIKPPFGLEDFGFLVIGLILFIASMALLQKKSFR